MPLRDGEAAALAPRGPTVSARHVGGRGGLVEEDQCVGIEVGLGRKPRLARRLHVRPLLLGGVDRPFLRVMRWRRKNRHNPLVLVATPRSARASRSSRR